MPTLLQIPIQFKTKEAIGLREQRGLHAILLGALNTASASLAETVHEMRVKPFSQALLPNKCDEPSTPWLWHVSLLDDGLVDPFLTGLAEAPPETLRQQPVQFQLDAVQRESKTYVELGKTPSAMNFKVSFLTPTSFKQRYYHSPLPTPYQCFQSWWRRWRYFAPAGQAINVAALDIVRAHLVVSYFNMRSDVMKAGDRHFIGGVGKMSFSAIQTEKVDAAWWQSIAVLAAYAPFCGTGHKTAQGMGQTAVTAVTKESQ